MIASAWFDEVRAAPTRLLSDTGDVRQMAARWCSVSEVELSGMASDAFRRLKCPAKLTRSVSEGHGGIDL